MGIMLWFRFATIAPTVFWGPMAYSIMGGLAVATALTLVFLPALYVVWFRIKETAPVEMDRVDHCNNSSDVEKTEFVCQTAKVK